MAQTRNLLTYLENHMLIGDGAMGTWLYHNGVPLGVCYEELCLSQPEMVLDVHRQYYEAGARLIETNTFGANREALARHGMEDLVYRINWKAAALAREAAGPDGFVAGSVSSVTAGRVRDTRMTGHRETFSEQMEALLSGGIDAFMLETFLDLEELLLAVETARGLSGLPIIAELALQEVGRTRDGYTLSEAFARLGQSGADVVGLNCRLGPGEMLRSLEQSVVPENLPIAVFPNAGRLGLIDDGFIYTSSIDYFADRAQRFREQGARIIGGCCGTTPAHIQAVARVLGELPPLPRINPERPLIEVTEPHLYSAAPERGQTLLDLVKLRHTVIVEYDPPKDLDIEEFLKGAATLQDAGADAVTMAENSLAQTRMSNLALGAILQNKLGIEPLVHLTCRDRNLIGQQSHLMGLEALGIHHILVVTGDPARFGDLPGASSVFDVSSFDLIRMVKQLNEGISFSGKRLNQQARFVVGAAFNPHVSNYQNALGRLEKKIEAGADFIMTQPVYDPEMIERIHTSTRDLPVPIFLGIMPLTSERNAEFLHNEVPGIRLPETALERMRGTVGEAGREQGKLLARELIEFAMPRFNGIYLMTPFSYYEMTADLTRFVTERRGE